jgi:DASS family divalent anion:Na+ symporter
VCGLYQLRSHGESGKKIMNTEASPPSGESRDTNFLRLLGVLAVGVVLWFVPPPAGLEPQAWHLLAIFVATVTGIIARPLPMGAIALMGLTVILLTGTLTTPQVLGGFGNATVWLVVCAYLLAGAFIRTGLGPRIAYLFLSVLGHRALGLTYSLAATDLVLAPFIPSHTARSGGAIFPILQSVARSFGPDGNADAKRTAGFLTMSTYQASISTSAIFLTSMAGNPLAAEFAGAQGISITWGLWLAAAVVPGLISLIVVPLVIYAIYPPTIRHTPQARVVAREQLAALGPLRRDERVLLVTFAALVVTWAFSGTLGIDNTAAALGAIAVLLVTRALQWDQVAREHEAWNTFVWFAALIMMANELSRLGVPKWFAGIVSAGVGEVHWGVGFFGISLAYFYSHYLFASNTAHISAMYAAFLAIALTLGTPPLFAALTLAFFSNLFAGLTHYSAATAPIFFAAGYVSAGTWWKTGFLVSLVNIPVWLIVGGLWWKVLGLW